MLRVFCKYREVGVGGGEPAGVRKQREIAPREWRISSPRDRGGNQVT